MSVVYLLHFDQPFGHARHYLGWASRLEDRLRHHEAGTGANLLKHARAAGVTWVLARTWEGDRYLERRMHNGGHARRCPVCKGQSSESGDSLDTRLPIPANGPRTTTSDQRSTPCTRPASLTPTPS